MLILHATTDIIRVVTGQAADIEVHASAMEVDNSAPPVVQDIPNLGPQASITTATTKTILDCTTANRRRNVKHLSFYNRHATQACPLMVESYDGTDAAVLWNGTLAAGELLVLNQAGVWIHYDSGGNPIVGGTGRFLQSTVLTAGTTFTTRTDTRTIKLRMVGGGGAGGGCTSVAAAAAAAGGGSAGAYAEKTFAVNGNTNYTYAIGGAGTGASGAVGGNGGSTTFAVGAVTVTAPGGVGGPVATAVTVLQSFLGGASASVATNGDLNLQSEPGDYGVTLVVATPTGISGKGGDSQFGSGGQAVRAVGNGAVATGYGAGGSGGFTGASAVRTGGNGTAGVIVVDEFS